MTKKSVRNGLPHAFSNFKVLREWSDPRVGRIRYWIGQPLTGYLLIALSVLLSATQVYYVYYNIGDEGDTFAVGWLVANGWSLYREVFSHHFPFSYLWVAAVVKVFGTSLFAVRFSLILLRSFVLLVAMKMSRYYFAVGLTAMAWSILGHLYLGNGLLYPSFSGLFVVGGFIIALAVVKGDIQPGKIELLTIGLLAGLSVLTDPLMVLPALVLIVLITLSGISNGSTREGVRIGLTHLGVMLCGLLASFSIVFVYLLISNGFQSFYQEGILFNTLVYTKYAAPITVKDILRPFLSFLDIFSKQWRYYTSPFFTWETFEFLDNWIFTGFFFRFSIIVAGIVAFTRRQFLPAFLIYLLGSTIIIRSAQFFHASPLVFFSLCCSSLMISGHLGEVNFRINSLSKRLHYNLLKLGVEGFNVFSWLVIFSAFVWLNVRGVGFLLENKAKLTYSENFSALQGNAGFLRKATCKAEQARVLVYPLDPIQYFLAEIPPASKYHFMTPWVAEVGQTEAISDLRDGPILVYVNRDMNIWGNPVEEYLEEFLAFLDDQYLQVEPHYYMSPQLQGLCSQQDDAN